MNKEIENDIALTEARQHALQLRRAIKSSATGHLRRNLYPRNALERDRVESNIRESNDTLLRRLDMIDEKLAQVERNNRSLMRITELARAVFDIPELFDLIFAQLSIEDILNAQQVNRNFRDKIVISKKLHQQMLLERPNHSRFMLHAREGWSTHIWNQDGDPASPSDRNVSILIHLPNTTPRIGPRCSRMYLCNPPITKAAVYTSCCSEIPYTADGPIRYFGKKIYTVEKNDGLTVGDMHRAARMLFRRHKMCSPEDAQGFCRDDRGIIDMFFFTVVQADLINQLTINASRSSQTDQTVLQATSWPYGNV